MSERGQALVEFALVLPLLVMFALAIVLVAEVGVARLSLEHAAAEGARMGALTNDDGEIGRVVTAALSPLDPARARTKIEPRQHEIPRAWDPRGTLLRVSLEYDVPVPLGFAGLTAVTVRAAATRVIEWTP